MHKNFYVDEVSVEFEDEVADISIGYADNDLGVAFCVATVNAAYAYGDDRFYLKNKYKKKEFKVTLERPFIVPPGKYLFVKSRYSDARAKVEVRGREQ